MRFFFKKIRNFSRLPVFFMEIYYIYCPYGATRTLIALCYRHFALTGQEEHSLLYATDILGPPERTPPESRRSGVFWTGGLTRQQEYRIAFWYRQIPLTGQN